MNRLPPFRLLDEADGQIGACVREFMNCYISDRDLSNRREIESRVMRSDFLTLIPAINPCRNHLYTVLSEMHRNAATSLGVNSSRLGKPLINEALSISSFLAVSGITNDWWRIALAAGFRLRLVSRMSGMSEKCVFTNCYQYGGRGQSVVVRQHAGS